MNIRTALNKGLPLLIALILVIIVGRTVLSFRSRSSPSQSASSSSITVSRSTSTAQNNPASEPKQQAQSAAVSASISDCVSGLSADTVRTHTQYDKGSILVTFNQDVTFEQAASDLAAYGLAAESSTQAKDSFGNQRLIIVQVPAGQEFSKICLLRRDALVHYAGLNIIFSLHE